MHGFPTKRDAVAERETAQAQKLSGQLKQHLQGICSKRNRQKTIGIVLLAEVAATEVDRCSGKRYKGHVADV